MKLLQEITICIVRNRNDGDDSLHYPGFLSHSQITVPSRMCHEQVKCLVLSQAAFETLLGPMSALIDEDRIRREQRAGVPMLQVG